MPPRVWLWLDRCSYVVDLDELKGFDKSTGKLLITVSFPSQQMVGLPHDVAAGPAGLYVSDQTSNSIYRSVRD